MEILKQAQYSPLPVEQQIAIIYCGTKGMLQKIPLNKIHNFELEFLRRLQDTKADLLTKLRQGVFTPEVEKELSDVANELIKKYEVK